MPLEPIFYDPLVHLGGRSLALPIRVLLVLAALAAAAVLLVPPCLDGMGTATPGATAGHETSAAGHQTSMVMAATAAAGTADGPLTNTPHVGPFGPNGHGSCAAVLGACLLLLTAALAAGAVVRTGRGLIPAPRLSTSARLGPRRLVPALGLAELGILRT